MKHILHLVTFTLLLVLMFSCKEDPPTPIQPKIYTIEVTTNGGGTVTPLGKTEVLENKTLTVNFLPNSGYVVDVLSVDDSIVTVIPTVFSYTFEKVTSNHKVEVTFKKTIVVIKKQYTVEALAGLNGTINPSGTMQVDSGGSKVFTIFPDAGFRVQNISVNEEVKSPSKSTGSTPVVYSILNIKKDYNISVTFEKTLSWYLVNNGSWTYDSLIIHEINGGNWTHYLSDYRDVVTFLDNGRFTIYRDGVEIGNGPWSIDESVVPAVLNWGGLYKILILDDKTLKMNLRDEVIKIYTHH
jgi:hypothetical protein